MSEADAEKLLAGFGQLMDGMTYVIANEPRPPAEAGVSPQAYLDWAAQTTLEWYDNGLVAEAVALFRYLMSKESTRMEPVLRHPDLEFLLVGTANAGRESFERFITGFQF